LYALQGKKVLLIAADKFRAASAEHWLNGHYDQNLIFLCGKDGQDQHR